MIVEFESEPARSDPPIEGDSGRATEANQAYRCYCIGSLTEGGLLNHQELILDG